MRLSKSGALCRLILPFVNSRVGAWRTPNTLRIMSLTPEQKNSATAELAFYDERHSEYDKNGAELKRRLNGRSHAVVASVTRFA